MTDLVSVVLPIFNVENYLDRCIRSVVNQTYQNLEIILVDDGSTDSCPWICEKWALKDSRILVIHKKNEGLGLARNTGIDVASGKYICFFDSDDYIAQDTIEKCCHCLMRDQSDAVCFGYKRIGRDGKEADVAVIRMMKETYIGSEVIDEFLPELIAPQGEKRNRFYMSAWSSMFSLEMLRKVAWNFASERDIIAEDIYSLLNFYRHVTCVTVIPEALYYYCENDHSITKKYRKDRYEKIRIFYLESLRLAEKLQYNIKIRERLSIPYFSFTISAMKQEVLVNQNKRLAFKNIKKIIDDDLLQHTLRNTPSTLFSRSWKIFFRAVRQRQYIACYLLLWLKR